MFCHATGLCQYSSELVEMCFEHVVVHSSRNFVVGCGSSGKQVALGGSSLVLGQIILDEKAPRAGMSLFSCLYHRSAGWYFFEHAAVLACLSNAGAPAYLKC